MSSRNEEIVRRKRGAALIWIKVCPSGTGRHPSESIFSKVCHIFTRLYQKRITSGKGNILH
jgi:hypothetical protein